MKICSVCKKENSNVEGNFCVFCGGKLIEKTKEKENKKVKKIKKIKTSNKEYKQNNRYISIIIVLIILLVSVTGYTIYFKINDNTSELKNRISKLEKQVSTLQDEKAQISNERNTYFLDRIKYKTKADFLDKNIVFVLDGYGYYYYTYDQVQQVTQGKSYTYWAYNIQAAINKGYSAWK